MTSASARQHLCSFLECLRLQAAVLVEVEATEGSAPRDSGTWMAVFADSLVATIGGGHLEQDAVAKARTLLAAAQAPGGSASLAEDRVLHLRFALGPALGQCCGGVVHLRMTLVTSSDAAQLQARLGDELQRTLQPVALFGGGHVGHALARLLARLPFALTWIDSRDKIFPEPAIDGVVCEHSAPVHAAVASLAPQSRVLIMSFSHAEDLDVLAACLQRQRELADLPYIGLIGSTTKWATFRKRLQARGFTSAELTAVTCPIGVAGIADKNPEVIAVAVAAQLLQTLSPAMNVPVPASLLRAGPELATTNFVNSSQVAAEPGC